MIHTDPGTGGYRFESEAGADAVLSFGGVDVLAHFL